MGDLRGGERGATGANRTRDRATQSTIEAANKPKGIVVVIVVAVALVIVILLATVR